MLHHHLAIVGVIALTIAIMLFLGKGFGLREAVELAIELLGCGGWIASATGLLVLVLLFLTK